MLVDEENDNDDDESSDDDDDNDNDGIMFSPMQQDDETHADLQFSSGQDEPLLPLYNSCPSYQFSIIMFFIIVNIIDNFMDI